MIEHSMEVVIFYLQIRFKKKKNIQKLNIKKTFKKYNVKILQHDD